MKIIAAFLSQFIWTAVLLAGFLVQPDSLSGYFNINSLYSSGLIQSDNTHNDNGILDNPSDQNPESDQRTGNDTNDILDKHTYMPKKVALEEYQATFDVGEPYVAAAASAENPAGDPSDQADADHQVSAEQSDSKLGSRGGAKSPENTADPGAGSSTGNDTGNQSVEKQSYNQIVLDLIKTYKGRYPYLLNQDYANYNGVTENIYYEGQLFLKAHPSGNRASHCVGITFEVFFKAMQEWNRQRGLDTGRIGNLSYSQLQDFMLQWYVADGQKEQSNLTTALTRYGLGKRITDLNEAKPGDFIDLSRENNTGHTVVFLGWVWEDGQIVGLKYWSSQESTGGLSKKTEYFNVLRKDGSKYGKVMIDQLYIGRVTP